MTLTPPHQPQAEVPDDEWRPYDLDHHAQALVIKYAGHKDVLNESHKMRMTIAYGLERFWGERFRLQGDSQDKANYWQDVWTTVAEKILAPAGIVLPNKPISQNRKHQDIEAMARQIWKMKRGDGEVALMVIAQFCDSLVWWTQRYKQSR